MCSNWNTCARNTQYLACVRECLHSDAAYQLKQFRKWQWSSQRLWHFPIGHFSGGVYLSFGNLPEEEKKIHQLVELRIQIRSATFLALFLLSFCFLLFHFPLCDLSSAAVGSSLGDTCSSWQATQILRNWRSVWGESPRCVPKHWHSSSQMSHPKTRGGQVKLTNPTNFFCMWAERWEQSSR